MLNDGGNENGKTNTANKKRKHVSLATTTKTTLHVQHTSFLHFFVVVLHDYSVKLSSCTFLGGNVSCSHNFFFLVSLLAFFFTAAHFHHTGRLKLSFPFSNLTFFVSVFCFISRSSPFSVKTRLCCCCCFSFSKSSGG